MEDKKVLAVSLLLIAGVILLYILNLDRANRAHNSQQDIQEQVNQNISEPPHPVDPNYIENKSLATNGWWLDEIILNGNAVSLDVNVPSALSLNFNRDNNEYNGFAGCNNYSGRYTSDDIESFKFGALVTTKMYCEGASELENKVLQAMDKVIKYKFNHRGELILESEDKQTRLQYVPSN